MKRTLLFLLVIICLLSGCMVAGDPVIDEATRDEATPDEAAVTEAPTEPEPDVTQQAMAEYERIIHSDLVQSEAQIDIEPIDQFPELPAGCEAVSLTMAINSYGYDLEKTDIVDNWLVYGDSFVDSYVGDPHIFLNGAGVYPPGLVNTVWNFVEDTDARLYPIDLTETDFEDLFFFIQAGYPIVLWSTYYDAYPIAEQGAEIRDGVVYQWYRNEHCVVLCGYDTDDNTVTLADPVRGIVTVSESTIENIYNEMGQFAMVMLDTTNYDFSSHWELPRYTYGDSEDDESEESDEETVEEDDD